jgi:S-DNA-T family DNA segregation ATPase FtsK/SpoIIIE
MTKRPDEVSIYAMDFGGWNLSVLKSFPHIGGIANDNEPERIQKLVALLQDLLEQRKMLFSKVEGGNVAAYREATGQSLPDVILVVDNFGPVFKLYPELDNFFAQLSSSGANYGVYLVATASAANAVPTKISQNIKYCLALQMIDRSDYTYLVGKAAEKLPPIPGRGLAKNTPPLEFQTALPILQSGGQPIPVQLREIGAAMNRIWHGHRPDAIPDLPESIPYGSISAREICLGLTCDKVKPLDFRWQDQHFLVISAVSNSERSNALHLISRQTKEKLGGKLYVFDINQSEQAWKSLADRYFMSASEIDGFVEEMRPELQKRLAEKQANSAASFEPITFVVCHYAPFFQQVSNDTMARLHAIVKIGAGLGLYILLADEAFSLASLVNKGEIVALTAAKASNALLLGGCLNDHGAVQTKAPYSQKGESVKPTEGYYICDGQPIRLTMMCAT